MYLKSESMFFFKLSANIYVFGLSNKLVFIIISQEAAKLLPVKVRGL